MIHVFSKARLLAFSTLEQALGRLGSLALEFGAKSSMTVAKAIHFAAAILLAIAVAGNVLNAQVNAKKVVNVFGLWLIHFAGGKQIELAVDQAQVGLATTTLQKFFGAVVGKKGNDLPTVDSPDGNLILGKLPSQDAIIKSDRAERLKFSLRLFVNSISIRHFSNTANCQLSRQIEALTNVMVDKLLNLKLAKYAFAPGYVANVITSSISLLKCTLQAISLCFGWCQFYLCG